MIIGLDVGGTKINGLVVDPATGSIVARQLEASHGTAPELAATIVAMVERLRAAVDHPITAVGLAVAGLAQTSGVIRYSPNLPSLVEYPLGDEVERGVERPVLVVNDANAGAWAEARHGAGQGVSNLAYVALGTGIGAGFVVDGRLLLGANGFAGEAGHMVVDHRGPTHITGQQGPWEYGASGTALGRIARDAAAAGGFERGLADAGAAQAVTGHHVAAALRDDDEQAERILEQFADNVAIGLANLVLILDPQRVIIGGGLTAMGERLGASIERSLHQHLLGAAHRPVVPVMIARFGADASAIGAALMAADPGGLPSAG